MPYRRYQNQRNLSKQEKISLMAEYIDYYEKLIKSNGIDVLNIKIQREVFSSVLDTVGSLLNEQAKKMAIEDGPVKTFLADNPLPPHMQELLPDEFRAFSLILNALKQWVSAESAATDRYLLGGTARETCRSAVNRCIVTGEGLGDRAELHHPLRDGRPPILLSKKGHEIIEHQQTNSDLEEIDDSNEIWEVIKKLRSDRNMSWVQLREGCNAILNRSTNCRAGAKSFANKVIGVTGISASEIIELLNDKGL